MEAEVPSSIFDEAKITGDVAGVGERKKDDEAK
jgi:hypothetical protein